MFIGLDWKLLVITGQQFVGYLPGGIEVYNISRIAVVPLSNDGVDYSDLELEVIIMFISTYRSILKCIKLVA